MNKSIFNLILMMVAGLSFAQKTIYTKAKVEAVKVYVNAAELQNVVQFGVPAGTSEVVIGNISDNIDEKTLQMSFSAKNISVLSSQFTDNYTADFEMDTANPKIKKVNDSINIVESWITKNKIEIEANKKAIELLDKNQNILVGSNTSNVAQLAQLTEFYTNKRIEIDQKLVGLNQKSTKLNEQLSRLKNSLKTQEEKESEEYASGVIILKINTPVAIPNIRMSLNYIANSVSWKPYYEVKGQRVSEPLDITFKAIVRQDTGLDWKGVKLTIVNGKSYRNNTIPQVKPWFLYAERPSYAKEEAVFSENDSSAKQSKLEEVVLVGYGYSVSNNSLNTSYEAHIPYDIASNDEEHFITLHQQKIPAVYQYFTAPNYRKEAYLVAKIKDFEQYDLTRASAGVIFEDMYVGETTINPNITENEMDITLGNDPKISITRQNIKEKSGEKFLSSYREKTITYDIVIKNNKKENIQIEVKDRVPLSNDDAIKIDLLELSGAKKDDEKGILTWNIKMAPAETKKFRVSYKVKYPKDAIINL